MGILEAMHQARRVFTFGCLIRKETYINSFRCTRFLTKSSNTSHLAILPSLKPGSSFDSLLVVMLLTTRGEVQNNGSIAIVVMQSSGNLIYLFFGHTDSHLLQGSALRQLPNMEQALWLWETNCTDWIDTGCRAHWVVYCSLKMMK